MKKTHKSKDNLKKFKSESLVLSCYFNAELFHYVMEIFCIFTDQDSNHYSHMGIST